MKRRFIFMLAAAVAALCGLMGCGGQPAGGDGQQEAGTVADGQDGNGEEKEGKEEGNRTDTSADSGNVSLKFWCDEDEMALFKEQVDAFINGHKKEANITVEYEAIGASECKDVFLGDVTNGADIFSLPDDQLLTMVAAGVLEEVADADAVAARNLQGADGGASVDGTLYAYPLTADNGYFLYYNKKYFTGQDVQTLDRILEVCAQNGKKFAMDWSSGWYLYSFFGNTGLTLSLSENGLSNSCNWNTQKGNVKGTDVAKGMLSVAKHPGFLNSDKIADAVLDGTAIAAVSGVWDAASVKKAFGKNYGACKLPTYTCAGKQVQMSSFTGYRLLGVNAYSKHKAWAEKLADYLSGEESQTLRFERLGRGPSNANAAASDAVSKDPAISAVLAQSGFGVLQKVGQKYWAPVTELGMALAAGNPDQVPLQDLLDKAVGQITE